MSVYIFSFEVQCLLHHAIAFVCFILMFIFHDILTNGWEQGYSGQFWKRKEIGLSDKTTTEDGWE